MWFEVRLVLAEGEERTAPVSVAYAGLMTGSATLDVDYEAIVPGRLVFAVGEDTKRFGVTLRGNAIGDEGDETIDVRISDPQGGDEPPAIARSTATGIIESPPTVTIASIDVLAPPDGETATATLIVSLGAPAVGVVSVDFADSGAGTAVRDRDYEAFLAGTFDFRPGETAKEIGITLRGNDMQAGDATVLVDLSNVSAGARIRQSRGTVRVLAQPRVSIDSPSVQRPPEGERRVMDYTIAVSPPPREPVTVQLDDAGSGSAVAGQDYVAVRSASLTFGAGETSQTFPVTVIGAEGGGQDVTVDLVLSSPQGATVETATGTGTIRDRCSDTPPIRLDGTIPDVDVMVGDPVRVVLPRADPATVCPAGSERYILRRASGGALSVQGLTFFGSNGFLTGTPREPVDPAITLHAIAVDGRGVESQPVSFSLRAVAPELVFDPPVVEYMGAWGVGARVELHGAKGGVPPIRYAVTTGADDLRQLGLACGRVVITRPVVEGADDTGSIGHLTGSVTAGGRFLPRCDPTARVARITGSREYTAVLVVATDAIGQTASLTGRLSFSYASGVYGLEGEEED